MGNVYGVLGVSASAQIATGEDEWSLFQEVAGDISYGLSRIEMEEERKRAEEERKTLLEDIKKINSKLEQSNKELQDFVYVASHDLREPLRKITSFGTLLQDSLEGRLDEDEQENFEFMINGAGRMQEMVDDLLVYSRVTTKAKPFEDVDLNKVIGDIKSLELAARLDETGGTIIVPESLPPVRADSSESQKQGIKSSFKIPCLY